MENTVEVIKPCFDSIDIFNKIFNQIVDYSKKKIINKKLDDGYFLFNFGKDTVCQFQIKGAKKWLFGIWAIPQDNGDVEVSLFGEHYWYLDKFKPTATKISETCTLTKEDQLDDLDWKLFNTIESIAQIANHPTITYITKYWETTGNPFVMYINDWIFYQIKLPIINFMKNDVNKFLTRVYKFYCKLRWNKYLNIDIYDSWKDGFKRWPRFDFNIRFKENVDEDTIYDIYHKIYKFKFYDRNVSIDFYEHNAKRPFCY